MDKIAALIKSKDFPRATKLVGQSAHLSEEEKAQKKREIEEAEAFAYCHNGDWEKAFNIFQRLHHHLHPLKVIRMFPKLLEKNHTAIHGDDDAGGGASSFPMTEALPRSDADDVIEKYVVPYLVTQRQRIALLLRQEQQTVMMENKDVSKDMVLQQAYLVDTALLLAYLFTREKLVGSLVRLPNHCHVGQTERILMLHEKRDELIHFYRAKNLHRKALTFLQSEGSIKEMISYLASLDAGHADSIFEFAEGVLIKDPLLGVQVFTHSTAATSLPRETVIEYLQSVSRKACVFYLEHLIAEGDTDDAADSYHTIFIFECVAVIKDAAAEGTPSDVVLEWHEKLCQFLQSQSKVEPAKILPQLPVEFFEERAILLKKLKRHERVIDIYVVDQFQPDKAKSYVMQLLQQNANNNAPFLYLFRKLCDTQKTDEAVQLLNTGGQAIRFSDIFPLIPDALPLHTLEPYLALTLATQQSQVHQELIKKNLAKCEHVYLREKQLTGASRRVVITKERNCAVCEKRIGKSAFVTIPGGRVAHLSCGQPPPPEKLQVVGTINLPFAS